MARDEWSEPPNFAAHDWSALCDLALWIRHERLNHDPLHVQQGKISAETAAARDRVAASLATIWAAAARGADLPPTVPASPAEIAHDLRIALARRTAVWDVAGPPRTDAESADRAGWVQAMEALIWWASPAPDGRDPHLMHIHAHLRRGGQRGSWCLPQQQRKRA